MLSREFLRNILRAGKKHRFLASISYRQEMVRKLADEGDKASGSSATPSAMVVWPFLAKVS
jgi:hypothetical protein